MQKSGNTTRGLRGFFTAVLAATVAVALSSMAFDANTLRTAFADEGIVETVPDQAEDDQQQDEDATVADDEEATSTPEQPREGEAGEHETEGEAPEASSRDGPVGEAEPEEVASEEQGSLLPEPTPETNQEQAEPISREVRVTAVSVSVTFYGNVESSNPSIIARKQVTGEPGTTVTVDVSDVEASAPTASQVFEGWEYQGQVATGSIEVDPGQGNVKLYPSFAEGHWLRFSTRVAGGQATEVASQFVGARQPVPETLPVSHRIGYSFDGWFMAEGSTDSLIADSNGVVVDGQALKNLLMQGDVELFAKWTGQPTTYRVVLWHENPDDGGFSYVGFEIVGDESDEHAVSGELTDARNLPEVAGFTLGPVEQKTIAGDGSTVVNVHYTRNVYSVVFHQGRTDESPLFDDLTITAKYGADIHDDWPQASEGAGAYTAAWYTLPDVESNVFVTGIGTMPLEGAHYYVKNDAGLNCNTVFRVQAVDGSNEFYEYVSQPFTTELSPSTTADDYKPIKGFMVNAASSADAESIRGNPAGDKSAVHDPSFALSAEVGAKYEQAPEVTEEGDVPRHTLYFHYLRCKYDIVFEENGGPLIDDVKGVFYESSLSMHAPSGYVIGQTAYSTQTGMTYEFAGWYENDLFAGDRFDFESSTMPAGNIVLFAKWVPKNYLVQLDPAGGAFDDSSQSTYFLISHGDSVGYRGVSRNFLADEAGGYVYEYVAYDGDQEGSGYARYVPAASDSDEKRYRFSEGAYTLFGWFELRDGVLSTVPFDFGAPVTRDTAVVARWKSEGVFDIVYNPVMKIDGGTVSGSIETRLDDGYADLSPTFITNTPTGIEADDGREWRFIGWQVVDAYGSDVVLDETLYQANDRFMVDSSLARDNVIHLQALYEPVPDEGGETPATPPNVETQGGDEGDTESEAVGDSQSGAVESGEASTNAQRAAGEALLPKTGDEVLMLAVGAGGVMLISLGVALTAYAVRRRHDELIADNE